MTEHLGGYIVGGDPATQFPHLWTWLVEHEGVESVLDVGCGEGQAVDYFHELGAFAIGIDGVWQPNSLVQTHDYETGPLTVGHDFDLVWCCEFLEHLDEKYLTNLRGSIDAAPLVLVTHAFPGQQGFHHVNCRDQEYWLGFFAGMGYTLDEDMTSLTRAYAAFNKDPYNHYTRSGLAFRRNREAGEQEEAAGQAAGELEEDGYAQSAAA